MGLTQVETGGVKDNSITSGKILDSEIETSDIKDGAVTTSKLANGAEDGKVLTSNNGSAPTFNTPTVEGTNVKSTGETDTTKFLRVDGDGTSSWQTPQGAGLVDGDNDGLAPQLPSSHGGKFLKADATWEVPPYPSTVDTTANGLAPILPNPHGGKFLKADGTWEVPAYIANTDTTYSVFGESADGLVPGTASGGGDSAKFLKGDATWAVPTVPDVTTNASGVVPQLPDTDETTKFLRGDKTWSVPPDTTYSLADTTLGGNGLVRQLPTDGGSADTTKFLRGDNTWVVPPATDISGKADTSGATFTGDITINDLKRLRLGTDEDASFYHNDTNCFLNNTKGDLHIRTTTPGDDVFIRGADDVNIQPNGGEDGIKVIGGGSVDLYYDGTKRFETTSSGTKTTGNHAVSNGINIGNNNNYIYQNNTEDGSGNVVDTGIIFKIGNGTNYNYVAFRRNSSGHAYFGSLGGQTNITVGSTSNLAIKCINGGSVELYHNGSGNKKLATTSTGIDVTGDITVSGTVDGVDVAKLDALAYCNLNKTSVTEDINVTTAVPIKWDNKVYKSTTYTHSTDTSETDTRQTIKVGSAGLYMINVTIGYDNTGANRITAIAALWKNGTELTETKSSTYSRSSNFDVRALQINTVLQLAVDDELEVRAWKDTANQDDAVNTIAGECEFVMTRLAGGVEAEA